MYQLNKIILCKNQIFLDLLNLLTKNVISLQFLQFILFTLIHTENYSQTIINYTMVVVIFIQNTL